MQIRDFVADDLPFLREMLYTAALWRPEDAAQIPMDVALADPQLAIYHEGWGRPGDTALIAVDGERRVGAVFYRLFTEQEHGHGYVNDDTPELGIAVVADARRRGVGRALMEAAAERARSDGVRRMALSVNDDNPSKLLYASLGYLDYEPDDGRGRMILDL